MHCCKCRSVLYLKVNDENPDGDLANILALSEFNVCIGQLNRFCRSV